MNNKRVYIVMAQEVGLALIIVSIMMMLLSLAGCGENSAQQLAKLKEHVAALEVQAQYASDVAQQLRGQQKALDAIIATMPDGPDKEQAKALRDKAVANLNKVQAFLEVAMPAIRDLNAKIQEATDLQTAAEAAARTGSSFLPPPWNWISALAIGVVFGVWREIAKRKKVAEANESLAAAEKVIRSVQPVVDVAIERDPGVADQLRKAQGIEGQSLVDLVQDNEPITV